MRIDHRLALSKICLKRSLSLLWGTHRLNLWRQYPLCHWPRKTHRQTQKYRRKEGCQDLTLCSHTLNTYRNSHRRSLLTQPMSSLKRLNGCSKSEKKRSRNTLWFLHSKTKWLDLWSSAFCLETILTQSEEWWSQGVSSSLSLRWRALRFRYLTLRL